MGTRGLTVVVLDGDYKVAQYGQWDHSPSGQGIIVCEFLQSADLDKFKQAVRECGYIDDKALLEKWVECGADQNSDLVSMDVSNKFKVKYPALYRDAGANILNLIQNGARDLKDSLSFAGDSLFCEYAYVLDLDNETLEVYKGFNKNKLSSDERFYKMPGLDKTKGYKAIGLCKKYSFANATPGAMEELEKELNKKDE